MFFLICRHRVVCHWSRRKMELNSFTWNMDNTTGFEGEQQKTNIVTHQMRDHWWEYASSSLHHFATKHGVLQSMYCSEERGFRGIGHSGGNYISHLCWVPAIFTLTELESTFIISLAQQSRWAKCRFSFGTRLHMKALEVVENVIYKTQIQAWGGRGF